MQSSLNFSPAEKKQVLAFFEKFPSLDLNSRYEEARVEIGNCSVTLYKSGKLLVQGKNSGPVKQNILDSVKTENRLVLGIDETGRGENFGPLVVAGVLGETTALCRLLIIIDGSPLKGIESKKAEFLPKADDKVVQVAAASILAKNARDNSKDKGVRKTWKINRQ